VQFERRTEASATARLLRPDKNGDKSRQGHEGDGPIWRACRNSDQVSIYPGSGDQLVTLIRIASGCGAPLDEKGLAGMPFGE